jgi:hypothetical protein
VNEIYLENESFYKILKLEGSEEEKRILKSIENEKNNKLYLFMKEIVFAYLKKSNLNPVKDKKIGNNVADIFTNNTFYKCETGKNLNSLEPLLSLLKKIKVVVCYPEFVSPDGLKNLPFEFWFLELPDDFVKGITKRITIEVDYYTYKILKKFSPINDFIVGLIKEYDNLKGLKAEEIFRNLGIELKRIKEVMKEGEDFNSFLSSAINNEIKRREFWTLKI